MVGRKEKEATVRQEDMPAGVAVIGYVDDIAVLGGNSGQPRRTRGVWDMRPPRPGRARPVGRTRARGQMGRQQRRRGRPPMHDAEDPMGPDYLRGVLAACRVTGMLARLDFNPNPNPNPNLSEVW